MICNEDMIYYIYSVDTGTVVEVFTKEEDLLKRFDEIDYFFPNMFEVKAINRLYFMERINL